MADTRFGEFTRCAKVYGLFFLILLAGQTNNDNMDLFVCVFSSSEEPCKKRQENECALIDNKGLLL